MYKNNKIYIILVLIIFNTLLYPLLLMEELSIDERFKTIFVVNFITSNIICFIIGGLLALLPRKDTTYKKRFLKISLLLILITQGIEIIGLSFIAICKWGLQYPI